MAAAPPSAQASVTKKSSPSSGPSLGAKHAQPVTVTKVNASKSALAPGKKPSGMQPSGAALAPMTFSSPEAGAALREGVIHEVAWLDHGKKAERADLFLLYRDGGETRVVCQIASGISSPGKVQWTVPPLDVKTYPKLDKFLLRVEGCELGDDYADERGVTFHVTALELTGGGPVFLAGQSYDITWTDARKTATAVDILLCRAPAGGVLKTLAANVPNSGTYRLRVPTAAEGTDFATLPGAPSFRLVVRGVGLPEWYAASRSVSAYAPKISITSPGAGAEWQRPCQRVVTWVTSGAPAGMVPKVNIAIGPHQTASGGATGAGTGGPGWPGIPSGLGGSNPLSGLGSLDPAKYEERHPVNLVTANDGQEKVTIKAGATLDADLVVAADNGSATSSRVRITLKGSSQ